MSGVAASHHRNRRGDRIARRLARLDPSLRWPLSLRLLMTIAPFAGFGLIVLFTSVLAGGAAVAFITGTTIGSFVGAGKFVILAGIVDNAPVSVWVLATLVVYGDIATALVMLANFHLLFRLPLIGKRLFKVQEASWNVLRANRWMRRAAWVGVAVFVAVPFQGTGAVVGTVLARLLVLPPWATLTAIAFGSALGCYPLALLGNSFSQRIEPISEHPFIVVGFFVLLFGLLLVLGRKFAGVDLSARRSRTPRAVPVVKSGDHDDYGSGSGVGNGNGNGKVSARSTIHPVPGVSVTSETSSIVR